MLESIREGLMPWYPQIRFVHLLAVMIWSFSTAVAYAWYVKSAWLAWERQPASAERKARRDWAMEQFDRGAVLEHVAFPVLLASGLTLFWLGGWSLSAGWLLVKLALVVIIFVPMEAFDYWISHFGGSKRQWREADPRRYERLMQWHWRFFRITTPMVMVFIPVIIYLAAVKPF